MRKPLAGMFVLATALAAGVAPAGADPARGGNAAGYGLTASGLVSIPRTPEVSATAPPDGQQDRRITVPIEAAPLAVNGTIGAIAQARTADNIGAQIEDVQDGNNVRAFALAEGLHVVTQGPVDVLGELLSSSLIQASVIAAEAVGRCVNNTPVYDTGFIVPADIRIGGQPVTLVNDVLELPLQLAGEGGVLEPIISVRRGETGDLPGGGRFVNALHVRVLPGTGGNALLDIIVSHAEVRLPTPCGVEAPPPSVAAERPLAATGRESSLALGSGLMLAAFLVMVVARRGRSRSEA